MFLQKRLMCRRILELRGRELGLLIGIVKVVQCVLVDLDACQRWPGDDIKNVDSELPWRSAL